MDLSSNAMIYLVDIMKAERLFKSQRGPIIPSQIENEYSPMKYELGAPVCEECLGLWHGDIKDVKTPLDQAIQNHCSFGFVTFLEKEDVAAMDNMDGAELYGRMLNVNYALPERIEGGEQGWAAQPMGEIYVEKVLNKRGVMNILRGMWQPEVAHCINEKAYEDVVNEVKKNVDTEIWFKRLDLERSCEVGNQEHECDQEGEQKVTTKDRVVSDVGMGSSEDPKNMGIGREICEENLGEEECPYFVKLSHEDDVGIRCAREQDRVVQEEEGYGM
ncbi:hypothetical protein REPUB_Repub09cG0122300 [Reevesia pubescens]